MITLIHGDDITASRNYYFDIKSKASESVLLDGSKLAITELTQALEGQDLFGDTKQIFIEDLLSKKKSPKEIEAFISLLTSNDSSHITLWESKELTPKQVANFKNNTIKSFKIPATIFALLDALKPKNGKQLIELFHKTLVDKDAEFVFFMLQRQIRILLAISSPRSLLREGETLQNQQSNFSSSESRLNRDKSRSQEEKVLDYARTISELSRIVPWQRGKLEKQASAFGMEKLIQLHSRLFEIELGMKTGNLIQPIIPILDLLLLKI